MNKPTMRIAKLTEIQQDPKNANRHTSRGRDAVERSLRERGFFRPMAAAGKGVDQPVMLAGNLTQETAVGIGMDEAIIIETDGTRPIVHVRSDVAPGTAEAAMLGIEDNRSAEISLDFDFPRIEQLRTELNLDLKPLWSDEEWKEKLAQVNFSTNGNAVEDVEPQIDKAEELREKWGVETGQLWQLGEHRLLCGDSTKREDVERLLQPVVPVLMVTDPPYGVEYDADWRNQALREDGSPIGGRAIGKVHNDDQVDWTSAWALFRGDVAYCWHDGRRASEVQASLQRADFEIRCQIIWAKQQFVIGRGDYHWKHEPCWYAVRKGKTGHWTGDRSQTTLWEIDKPIKSETGHSTQKPLECMARPIRNNSQPGDAIYEPFCGSGTTLIACEQLGRKCRAIEISPAYVAVTLQRWADATGKQPKVI